MNYNPILLGTLIGLLCFSCEDSTDNTDTKTGILKGTISIFEGNCMPGPGVPPCVASPLSTRLAITRPAEEFSSGLLIRELISASDGSYETNLPEGNYSLFILDGDAYSCTSWSCPDSCYCVPFLIAVDSVTVIDARVDHAVW